MKHFPFKICMSPWECCRVGDPKQSKKVCLYPKLAQPCKHFCAYLFLQFDYFNSLLINTVDEEGNPIPLGGEFLLEKNEHFNKLPVNTQQSNIQVPTNVYNQGNKTVGINLHSKFLKVTIKK